MHGRKCCVEFAFVARVHPDHLLPEGSGSRLRCSHLDLGANDTGTSFTRPPMGHPMSSHKFGVGETVYVLRAISRNVPGGAYEVTKQLPHNGREFEYRVKSTAGPAIIPLSHLAAVPTRPVACDQHFGGPLPTPRHRDCASHWRVGALYCLRDGYRATKSCRRQSSAGCGNGPSWSNTWPRSRQPELQLQGSILPSCWMNSGRPLLC
jgi:hypothetical protein